MNTRQFYIDGRWVDPIDATDADVIDPSTEAVIATVSLGSDVDTDAAVAAASRAFAGWATSAKSDRLALLRDVLKGYLTRADEMADTISREMGAPIRMARSDQAAAGSEHIEATIDALEDLMFEHDLHPDEPDHRILLEPIGVCALITPWNWPMNQVALKVAPALAAGCTMVLKPSELAPLSSMLFAEILHDAAVPAGVFNLVNGDGAGVGTRLSVHPQVSMVSFTGSTRAGSAISKNAADSVKRVSLELGGKGANIIFADASPDAVTDGVTACMHNTGQSCDAPTRMLVERARYDEAVEQARAAAEATPVASASTDGDHIGPLVGIAQYDKVRSLIRTGIDLDGARLVAGGLDRPDELQLGYFVRPTVFADCNSDMTIMREEIFGPVLSMMPFDTEQQAIALANDTDLGLTNYVQTSDPSKAMRVARQLRSGMVELNGTAPSARSPFGGYQGSGNGREGGRWGIEEFLETKAVRGWSEASA